MFETENKMEVLWYVSKYAVVPDFGNPTRQYFLAKSFSQKGKKVTLVSSRSSALSNFPSMGFKNKIEILDENLKCVILNGSKINLGFNYTRIISWITFELRFLAWAFFSKKERPNVIIVSSLSLLTFFSGVILKKFYGCKLVCEVRDIWPLTISQLIKWKQFNPFLLALQRIESYAYKNANLIVGTMPNLREHVSSIDASLGSKVFYIPMGFSKEFYSKDGNLNIISSSTDIKINIGVDDDEDDNNSVDSFEKYLSKVQATEDEDENVNEDDEYEENLLEDTNHQIPYNEEANYDNLTDSDDENKDNDFDTDDEDSEPQKRSFFINP